MIKLLLCFALCLPAISATDDVMEEMKELQEHSQKILQQVQKIQASDGMQKLNELRGKIFKLAGDDRFLSAAGELWQHPRIGTLLIAQAIFFIVMLFVRAWRAARAGNWFIRILVGMCLSLFTWICLLYVIPVIVLGEPFQVFVSTLWNVFVY